MDFGLRLTVASALSLAPLGPLTLRLAHLQVLRHEALSERAEGEFSRTASEAAPRADITDRKGRVLARSVPTWSVFLDKKMLKDPAELGRKLGPILKVAPGELERKARASGRFCWLKTGVDFPTAQAVQAARVECVGLTPSSQRVYPNEGLARPVLGVVGAEGKGLSGLELSQEKRLRGKPRRLELTRDGKGRAIHRDVAEDGEVPAPLKLTIDRNVQYIVEEALAEGAGAHAFKSGYAAVQDPRTGEILAMAAWPPNPLKNPLVQDAYEPGSTFKVVTALAAVEERLVGPAETFSGEGGKWQIAPGVTITDHEPEPDMTLAQILERSSNIGIAKVVERVGPARFFRAARALGFGLRTGVPLPGETAGDLKPFSDLGKVGLAASSYGYGLSVSPLQMLGAYSALANGGTLYEPRLLDDGTAPEKVRRVASERAVGELARMLEAVVDHGTGQPARIPGYRVAGKTGTARKLDPLTRKYSQKAYVASFAGWLPASAPRWTILVIVDEPTKGSYYGGLVAAPVFAKIGRRLLTLEAVAPDRPAEPAPDRGAVAAARRVASVPPPLRRAGR
ncbi:MAG: penicillin-binding protein 2 [Elusimicrobiota bacterium]|nr:penicillin-binding protein 2 [Elusimicrobiota bacterium]